MPATNSPKSTPVPVRITPAMRRQIDDLIALGYGTQSEIIRLAEDRMRQEVTRPVPVQE